MEDPTILYYSISLLLLILAYKFLLQSKTPHKNLPPTLLSFPIIGHLHLLKPPLHRTFHKLSQKYGPIISLRFGSRLAVVVSSPSIVKECFTKNDIVLANRFKSSSGQHLSYNHTTMVNLPYGEQWRHLRRISANEIFSTNRLNMLLSIRQDEIKRLLLKLSRDSCNEFAKVELKPMFNELTFNIMMRMLAGKRYYGDHVSNEEEAIQFRKIMREIADCAGALNLGDFIPILNWIDLLGFEKKVLELGKKTDAFLQGLINEHRSKQEGLESMNTTIDHLLTLQESNPDTEDYNDQIIKGLIRVLLFGGTDTTSFTLEWAMSNLVNHPHVLEKVRAELDAQVGQERLVDEPDLFELPYLQSIISETLRLYPVAPLLLPHVSSANCKIGGYDVPRDTMLFVNAWAIHRDPKLWDDATSFKPERFENGQNDGYKLMPFGLGRRSCPGAGLAQRMIGLTLGLLIQCFEWERVSEEEVDMEEGKGIIMSKAVPLEALCKTRPVMNKVLSEVV